MRSAPEFPEQRSLELGDKPFFDALFKKYPPAISELTFTNLFAWRKSYRFGVSRIADCILVLASGAQGVYGYDPVGDPGKKRGAILACFARDTGIKFERITQETAALFEGDAGFRIEEQRRHFDYVYRTRDLVGLRGQRYDGKRNFIRRFREEHPSFVYKKITPANIVTCLSFQEEWCRAKDCLSIVGLKDEREAMTEMLENFEALGMAGGMIEIDGRVEAAILGEPLNPATFVVHMEKTNGRFTGLYQVINQLFCVHEAQPYEYVNREQDLGLPGLRLAKESYHPCAMVKKYALIPKDAS